MVVRSSQGARFHELAPPPRAGRTTVPFAGLAACRTQV